MAMLNNSENFEINVKIQCKGDIKFSVNQNTTGEEIKNMLLDYCNLPRDATLFNIAIHGVGKLHRDKSLGEQGITAQNNSLYFSYQ